MFSQLLYVGVNYVHSLQQCFEFKGEKRLLSSQPGRDVLKRHFVLYNPLTVCYFAPVECPCHVGEAKIK